MSLQLTSLQQTSHAPGVWGACVCFCIFALNRPHFLFHDTVWQTRVWSHGGMSRLLLNMNTQVPKVCLPLHLCHLFKNPVTTFFWHAGSCVTQHVTESWNREHSSVLHCRMFVRTRLCMEKELWDGLFTWDQKRQTLCVSLRNLIRITTSDLVADWVIVPYVFYLSCRNVRITMSPSLCLFVLSSF